MHCECIQHDEVPTKSHMVPNWMCSDDLVNGICRRGEKNKFCCDRHPVAITILNTPTQTHTHRYTDWIARSSSLFFVRICVMHYGCTHQMVVIEVESLIPREMETNNCEMSTKQLRSTNYQLSSNRVYSNQ